MKLIRACKDILDQLAGVVREIRDEDFSKQVPTLNNSTIGQHIRHTLEFFICLKNNSASGIINYDNRNHDQLIETDKHLALNTINELSVFFTANSENKPLKLAANYCLNNDQTELIETNFLRELAYNIEHAIHHMAIIKIGVKEIAPYIELPPHFGVAVSTIKFQKNRLPSTTRV
ncbi:DinB family protein [Fulvivirga ulvae]|uniref:DinB family protein n=1 Tax=Fulvivirga ulvae TaxID=2904245 RepID=UPI001F1F575A|nr:DinB family protein [Fulvivirga ulvae]UII34449.1 DinB family protein [Fulvivirga ulvae]